MNKIDEVIIAAVAIFILTFCFLFLVKIPIAALFIAFLCYIFLRTVAVYFYNRRQITKKMSLKETETFLAIMGTEKQKTLLFDTLPERFEKQITDDGIEVVYQDKKILIVPLYRFSPPSCEDIAKLYRKDIKCDRIYFIGKTPTRETLLLARSLFAEPIFVSPAKVKKYLERHNAMPEKPSAPVRRKKPVKQILAETFVKEKARFFFFASFLTLFYCLFSPYRVWYIAFCITDFILGVVCLFSDRFSSPEK